MNLETYSANVITIDEAVKAAAVHDQQNEWYIESEVLSEVSSGAASENVVTMDETIDADSVPDQ